MPENLPWKKVTWELADIRIIGKLIINPDDECQPVGDKEVIATITRMYTPADEIEYCEQGMTFRDKPDREWTERETFEGTILYHAHNPTAEIICPTYIRFRAKLIKKTTILGTCFPSFVIEGSVPKPPR
jgi:hypothetical protein